MNQITSDNIVCQQAEQNDFLLGNRFLKTHGQATAGRADKLFTVKINQNLVGAAWLRLIENDYWLRSLFVLPEYRNQKLASKLLDFFHTSVQQQSNAKITCLAKAELTEFYLKNGYTAIAFESLSNTWQKQFSPYLQQHPTWQIFIR
ncbi:GNAT family N-acetyltransferase [Hydrogenovibrio sp. JE_KL2]|uniref:GNAT family N-acetyltransferase n=1 Tax=Hydrogenovibrio sp. JE_KL2 TaxID=2651188 RepID=UPI00128B0523